MLLFVESRLFSQRMQELLPDNMYRELQACLSRNPRLGAVIPGCGGLRKIRIGDASKGKGKQGGIRIIYLHLPELQRIHLVALYGKGERDDLSSEEKRALNRLVDLVKAEAMQTFRKSGRKR